MRDVIFKDKPVNPAKLHEELKAALGDDVTGVSTRRGDLVVHLVDGATAKEADVGTVVNAHDPSKLTTAQQFQEDQAARFAALQGKAWADWTDGDKDDLLRYLAGQIGLLEGSQA